MTAGDPSQFENLQGRIRGVPIRLADQIPEGPSRVTGADMPWLPSVPADVIADIYRAGGAQDFQGVAEGDPDMPIEDLRRVAALGPWGAWIAAWHPNAPADLVARREQEPAS